MMLLNSWAMRSNDFSKDILTYSNSSNIGIDLKGRAVEASIHSGFLPSFVFWPLDVYDIRNILRNMQNAIASRSASTNGISGRGLIVVDGVETITNDGATFEQTYSVSFDPMHRMFPVEGSIFMRGHLLNKWTAIYLDNGDTNYYPQGFAYNVFNENGKVVLSTLYTNIAVSGQVASANKLVDSREILKGSIVNDYRYGHPFAYVQGVRDPNLAELLAMSTNNKAIITYQVSTASKTTVLIAPFSYDQKPRKGHWIVISFMMVITIVSLYLLLIRKKA
jgi:hypothetical protein